MTTFALRSRAFKFTAMDIFRFKDGMVVERWGNSDSLILIRQLGLEVDLSLQPLAPVETQN